MVSQDDGGGLVTQSCLTLTTLWTVAHPSSPVHGILQAGILDWVTMSSSRGSSQHRDQPMSPGFSAL